MLSFKILFTWTLKFFSLIYPRLNYDNWFETLKRKFDLFEIIKQKKITSITTRLTWVFTCRCCGIKAVYKALTDDSSSGFSASWRWGRLIVALLDVVGIPSTRKSMSTMIVVCRQKNIHLLCYNVCCFPRLWRWLRLLVYFDLGPFFYALEWPLHWWQWYIRHHPWPIRAHFLQDYKCNFTKNCSLVLPVAGGNIWVTTASGTVTVLDCSTVVTCVSSSVFSGWRPDKSKTYT